MACCDSIIQYRCNMDWPLVPEPAKAPLITDWRLRAGSFAPFLHEVWKWRRWKFKMWAILTEKEKIINEHWHYWTKRWISWGHHACLLVIQLRLQLLVASVLIESNSLFAQTCFFYFLLSWRHYNWSDSPSGRWTCESMFPLFKTFFGPIWGSTWSKSLKGLTGTNFTGRCALTVRRKKTRHSL